MQLILMAMGPSFADRSNKDPPTVGRCFRTCAFMRPRVRERPKMRDRPASLVSASAPTFSAVIGNAAMDALLSERHQQRVLDPARHAPRREHVDQARLARGEQQGKHLVEGGAELANPYHVIAMTTAARLATSAFIGTPPGAAGTWLLGNRALARHATGDSRAGLSPERGRELSRGR
jgi:hypothetical protein